VHDHEQAEPPGRGAQRAAPEQGGDQGEQQEGAGDPDRGQGERVDPGAIVTREPG
jgi:hypothetical protein